MDPKHIWWPVYQDYIAGNVDNVLNQTTGYDGAAGQCGTVDTCSAACGYT
jgi:hypothetical protein